MNYNTILPPFKWFVLQNFPYIEEDFDALTNWQLFCKLGKEMNKIIEKCNLTGEQVENLTNAYNELKAYVDNYFENLDIQEEVNTKLDEMAQSGELADLIAQYLEAQAIIGFNTNSSLAGATNLGDGSFARTYGKETYNDGKGAFYKIRERLNADVPDGDNIIVLTETDNLVAEKMPEQVKQELEIVKQDPVNVKLNGVIGDGETDDTTAIQDCIDNNPHKTIYFPEGTYLISAPLVIPKGNEYQVNLLLDENAVIKTETEIDSLLEIGADDTPGTYDRYSPYGKLTIQGGTWDATNTTHALYTTSNRKFTIFKDLYVINVEKYGIYLDRGNQAESISTDARLFNISISGNGADINPDAVGLYVYGTDNEFDEIRIQAIKKCIRCNSGGELFSNLHLTASYSNNSLGYADYNNTIGVELTADGPYNFNNLYVDTYAQAIAINGSNVDCYINNLQTFYWKNDSTFTTSIFKLNGLPRKFIVNGGTIAPPSSGTVYGINTTDLWGNAIYYFSLYNRMKVINCRCDYNIFSDEDLINCLQIRNEDSYNANKSPWTKTMTQNAYYQFALLSEGIHDLDISMADDQLINAIITVNSNGTGSITVKNLKSASHANRYTLALVNSFVGDKSQRYSYLAVKSDGTNQSLNPVITKIFSRFASKVYKTKNITTELSSPSVVATASFNP